MIIHLTPTTGAVIFACLVVVAAAFMVFLQRKTGRRRKNLQQILDRPADAEWQRIKPVLDGVAHWPAPADTTIDVPDGLYDGLPDGQTDDSRECAE